MADLFKNTDGEAVPIDATTLHERIRVHLEPEWEERDAFETEDLLREAMAVLALSVTFGLALLTSRSVEPARSQPEELREAAGLLFNWLNSEMQSIRENYVAPSLQHDDRRVNGAWQHIDPDGYELAVATRELLSRVGFTVKEEVIDDVTNQSSVTERTHQDPAGEATGGVQPDAWPDGTTGAHPDMCVDDHCSVCGEYESECEC